MVQSAVSQQIRRLEREWGVVLFERTTRRVGLSGAGERLLTEARAVLAAADRAARVASDITAGDEGILRLAGIHGPGDRIERVLGELAVGAPLLQVRLHRLPVARRLAAVRAGELDAAWVRAVPSAPGLEVLPLWDDPLYVALPEGHPLAAERVLRLEQLVGLPVRLAPRESNPPFHELVTGALRAAGTRPVLGPPFTDLRATLTAIGTARAPSWTLFHEVHGLPSVPRVAVRPLAGLAVTTSLAVRPDPPGPALRHLLRSLRAVERETSQHPCV
ncbi:LysR substrate-binding domain-containing protein [Streptomyces sp. NPDC058583]|uniref:LysR substrate-binding domain-containing protein n=1 Tax=unclassified Streptomyces TaxID=2593676 RepID=UPI00364A1F6C